MCVHICVPVHFFVRLFVHVFLFGNLCVTVSKCFLVVFIFLRMLVRLCDLCLSVRGAVFVCLYGRLCDSE